jgi:hypothetical protein
MSRLEFTTRRTLAFAGMVLTATLAIPAVAHAQSVTGEQMLLNRIVPTAGTHQRLVVAPAEGPAGESTARIDGASAMLGRPTADTGRQPGSGTILTLSLPETPIDGRRALLGRVGQVKPRPEGVE